MAELCRWCPCCLAGLDELEQREGRGDEVESLEETCDECLHHTPDASVSEIARAL